MESEAQLRDLARLHSGIFRRREPRLHLARVSAGPTKLVRRSNRKRHLDTFLVESHVFIPLASSQQVSFFSFFFFGRLSIHLSQALLTHLFSYNITWGATKKEVERSNFWLEVPKILKCFWLALVLSLAMGVFMVILATNAVPVGWRIFSWDWAVILPLA
ncbi:hypothetical protein BD413DRAFT_578140 [Trametes elegans]|nr:hypothetical protein BD413DRAFT_578140 [Trametes elegans]